MTWYTFQRAFLMGADDEYVTLGGGEPTLWKLFPEALDWIEDMLYGMRFLTSVLMITNGTRYRNTMRAIRFMENTQDLGEKEFQVVLSAFDGYHDDSKIHPKILEYFTRRQSAESRRTVLGKREYVRTVTRVMARGRGKNIRGAEDFCGCPDIFAQPDGKIRLCGCPEAPIIGDVFYGINEEYRSRIGGCWGEQDEQEVHILGGETYVEEAIA